MHPLPVAKCHFVELPHLRRGVVLGHQQSHGVEADGTDRDMLAGGEKGRIRAINQSCLLRRHETFDDDVAAAPHECCGVVKEPLLCDLLI